MHTWNVIFGFSSLEPSLKQEMRLMNMLVFPGTDMLQKLLIQESIVEENPSTGSGFCLEGAKRTDCRSTEFSSPKIDTETSSGHEPRSCDDTEQHHFKAKTNEVAVTNPNPESVSVSLNDTSTANSPLDAFCEAKMPCSPMQTVTLDSDSDDKPGIRHGLEDRSQSTSQCMAADTSLNTALFPVEENPSTGSGFCLEGAKRTDCRSTEFSSPKIDTETSSGHEPRSCDDTEQHHFKAKTNEVAVTNPNPESVSVSLNDTSTANSPLDAFCEAKMPCSPMQTVTLDSDSDDKPGIRHGLEDRSQSTSQCMAADTSLNNFLEPKVKVSNEGIICSNAHAGHKLADSVYVRKSFSPTTGNGTFELENVPSIMDSPEDDAHANSLKPTRPFETTSDCKNAIAYVKEAISDGICGSENSPQSCGAKARGGLQEERAESGSV